MQSISMVEASTKKACVVFLTERLAVLTSYIYLLYCIAPIILVHHCCSAEKHAATLLTCSLASCWFPWTGYDLYTGYVALVKVYLSC